MMSKLVNWITSDKLVNQLVTGSIIGLLLGWPILSTVNAWTSHRSKPPSIWHAVRVQEEQLQIEVERMKQFNDLREKQLDWGPGVEKYSDV